MKKRFRFWALKLCGIMFLVFVVQLLFSSFTDLFLLNSNAFIEVWRFFTAIFLHGGFAHLLYNTFALALFGSMLERLIGTRRFLIVFFVTGIIANLISVNFYDSSLGASGAIFGVIGALVAIRPLMIIFAFGFPMPLFIAGIIWASGDLIGLFVPSNVANLAHLSGMFFGLIIGFLYRKKALRSIG
jgi:membrane associated rhomboid family serine protease